MLSVLSFPERKGRDIEVCYYQFIRLSCPRSKYRHKPVTDPGSHLPIDLPPMKKYSNENYHKKVF